MALFGQFLAIKWVKMAGSKMAVFGSRPSSTQWTRYMYWFSRNDNFEIRMGDWLELTHCALSICRHHYWGVQFYWGLIG